MLLRQQIHLKWFVLRACIYGAWVKVEGGRGELKHTSGVWFYEALKHKHLEINCSSTLLLCRR